MQTARNEFPVETKQRRVVDLFMGNKGWHWRFGGILRNELRDLRPRESVPWRDKSEMKEELSSQYVE